MSIILPVASRTVVVGSSWYQSLLKGARLINLELTKKEDTVHTIKSLEEENHYSSGLHCKTCQIAFEFAKEHRAHYKSDWHRYNLKQKIRNRQTIDERKFLRLENKNYDSSSSSESDDESDDVYNSHCSINARLFFENNSGNAFSVYRCLLTNKKDIPDEKIILHSLKSISSKPKWFIVMLGGGRFSAAIFKGKEAIVHKTCHTYTVRAKQGCSQSTHDRKKGGCKSPGANLRRYNEDNQFKHIRDVLTLWLQDIKECDLLFYQAPGQHNRNILFGGLNPLIDKNDSRLCQIPFGTKKPTFAEVKKAYNQLSTVLVYDTKETIDNFIENYMSKFLKEKKNIKSNVDRTKKPIDKPIGNNLNSKETILENVQLCSQSDFSESDIKNRTAVPPKKKKKSKRKEEEKEKRKETKTTDIIVKRQEVEEVKKKLLQTIKEKDIEALRKLLLLEGLNSSITQVYLENILNKAIDKTNNTALHLATTNCLHDHIYLLLLHGSNPVNKNKEAKTPFELAPDKSIRNVFRKFRAVYPDKYNYDKACIPGPLTEEIHEKLKKRKKAQQKRANERKQIEKLKIEEEIEKLKFLQLPDREKCAIAAERRFVAAQSVIQR